MTTNEVILPAKQAGFRGKIDRTTLLAALTTIILWASAFAGIRAGLMRWGWIGIGMCFLGVSIISLSSGEGFRLEPAALLVLAAAVCQASYSVAQKPLLKKYGARRFVTYAIWAGAAFLLVFAPG